MLPEQKAYIYAWVDAVTAAGFRAGIYCSGIPAKDDGNIVTAEDIPRTPPDVRLFTGRSTTPARPRPAALFPCIPPSPAESGVRFAEVWQFAQSPQRKDVAGSAPTTVAMATVIRRELLPRSNYMWT
jgi:hypothetical protein